MYNKAFTKAYAVALLREDLRLTYDQISNIMGFNIGTGRYLYNQFVKQERKSSKVLELFPKNQKQI